MFAPVNSLKKGSKMEQRKLGNQGLVVSALGLGCMGMSYAYGSADENEAIATIHEAIDLGVDFFDTAEIYGPFENEKLVGRALKGKRDKVIIATKFGFDISPEKKIIGANSRPDHVKKVADESLQRLGNEDD
jgi:aryl-alcohol dehydrogenase-like predicted oxidoreductase